MLLSTLVLTLLAAGKSEPLAPPPEKKPDTEALAPAPAQPSVGAAVAPATLPGGAMAFHGFIGAPDVGLGYRQGFDVAELEARAFFNYLELSGVAEVGARIAVVRHGALAMAPGLFIGAKLDSGNRYYDKNNFAFIGVRPRLDFTVSYQVADTVQLLGKLDVPWTIATNVVGMQFVPTLGAGAEFHVGGPFTMLALGQFGVDVVKEPLGVTQLRPGWAIRLGIGYRFF